MMLYFLLIVEKINPKEMVKQNCPKMNLLKLPLEKDGKISTVGRRHTKNVVNILRRFQIEYWIQPWTKLLVQIGFFEAYQN